MAGRLKIFGTREPSAWRRAGLVLLVLAVIAVHGCVSWQVADGMDDAAQPMPQRVEVAYVRELAEAAPPAVAPTAAAPPAAAPAEVSAPDPAASAAEAAEREKLAKAAKARKAREAAERLARAREKAAEEEAERLARNEAEARLASALAAASAAAAASQAESVAAAASSAAQALAAAASAPLPAASAPRVASAPSSPASSSALAAATPASGAEIGGFEWPVSTRVSYALTGNYRGEVQGEAHVEWVRIGPRYQVHLDILVGPSFAPVVSRQMTSDGEIGAEGLQPRRYDQDTKVAFTSRKRVSMSFTPDAVTLANGDKRDMVPGLQDTASQFVQLTYMFTLKPELLRIGTRIEMPLALPHKIDRWIYDVIDEQTLHTPFGELATVHLKPRRSEPKIGELSAEIWFAPTLRYLPVRIRIQQSAENFVDMMISRRPEMAAQ